MPIIYRMADVFVLPSKGPGETWGLAVNEAMASGRPVIVSDKCGAAADLIEEGVNGFVCKSQNHDSLLEKMQLCLGADLSEMGRSASNMIQHFSYKSFGDTLKSLKFLKQHIN